MEKDVRSRPYAYPYHKTLYRLGLITTGFLLLAVPHIYWGGMARVSKMENLKLEYMFCCAMMIVHPIVVSYYFRLGIMVLVVSIFFALVGIHEVNHYKKAVFRIIAPFSASVSCLYGNIVANDIISFTIITFFYFLVYIFIFFIILSTDTIFGYLR